MNILKRNEKGITLVALGVMLIILLILAGVATSNMDKMNDVVSQAEEIKKFVESKNEVKQSEERILNNEAISYIIK